MQKEHREAIRRNFVSLIERTDLEYMVTALYEKGVFSEAMIEKYRDRNHQPRELKRRLFRDITRRGPDAFGHLLDTLEEAGLWNLMEDLGGDGPRRWRPPPVRLEKPKPKPNDNNYISISAAKSKSKPAPSTQTKTSTVKLSVVEQTTSTASTSMAPDNRPGSVNNNDEPDPATAIPNFHVKKSKKFVEDEDSKDIKLYRTRGKQRGVLLVFAYISFCNDEFRDGVDVDCKNLKYLFTELGFRPVPYQNLTKAQTLNTLASLKEVLTPGVESVFVVVSSHGYEVAGTADTDIRCSDGALISLYDVIKFFDNRSLPHLADVPKVFIFQICRGGDADYVWGAPCPLRMPDVSRDGAPDVSRDGAPDVSRDGAPDVSRDGAPDVTSYGAPAAPPPPRAAPPDLLRRPLYSNILIAHSTLPGFVSHRDTVLGSWYIQTVCDVFAERAHDCHVDKLFTLVDQRLQDRFKVQTSSVDRWGFNRRLYLHPGLYE